MKMKILKGFPLSGGSAEGAVCLYKEDVFAAVPKYSIPAKEAKGEIKRLRKGLAKTKKELEEVQKVVSRTLTPTEAEIFRAHVIILEDQSFIKQIEDEITIEQINTEWALVNTIEKYTESFSNLPGDFIRERADDLHDIAKRIVNNLGYKHTGFICTGCQASAPIVASETLTTSLISHMGNKRPAGVLIEKGSPVSHGAIMAKALGIPVLIKVENLISHLGCGTPVIIDADAKKVYIRPGAKTREKYKKKRARKKPFKKLENGLVETSDGERIRIAVNASSIEDVKKAARAGVGDIGLFRTEFLFTGRETSPGVEEQARIYTSILKAAEGETAFRLLDSGTDKEMPYLHLPRQGNPDLGLRGARLYSRYPEILDAQAEAIAIAAGAKPFKIIVPMVAVIEEFLFVKKRVSKILKSRARKPGSRQIGIKFGCMIELPAAVQTLGSFIKECDFLSIGTNDLIQYMMGADRNNDYLEELSNPLQPAVVGVLKLIAEQTEKAGIETVVCGEMAGAPDTAELLVGLGYRSLSMDPSGIEATVDRLRSGSLKKMQSLAESFLSGRGKALYNTPPQKL